MKNRQLIKFRLDRRDHLRCIVTDTSPYEVPVIFSNDGFYKNLQSLIRKDYRKEMSQDFLETFDYVILKQSDRYTIPYNYKIARTLFSKRKLSLIHPRIQYEIAEMYGEFSDLIIFYCSKSSFSLRHPKKVSSAFYFRSLISDINKYKTDSVDSLEIDKLARHPASFFAYGGYDRFYKFFESNEFDELEKRFPILWIEDVSHCFGNIYTHTISWAVKEKHHAKNYVQARTFGNVFDRIMQKGNFNETSGIVVGPEASRIFAEMLFQQIDIDIEIKARESNLFVGEDFDVRRYVDDFAIFAKNEKVAAQVHFIISDAIAEYKMSLNEGKMERYTRPFQTAKSQTVVDLRQILNDIEDSIFEVYIETKSKRFPRRIFRPEKLLNINIKGIRSCCWRHDVGYDFVSPYAISALLRYLEELIDFYVRNKRSFGDVRERYIGVCVHLLNLIYFLYLVHPLTNASYSVAKATLQALDFVTQYFPEHVKTVMECISINVQELCDRHIKMEPSVEGERVPIETINLVLASSGLYPEFKIRNEDVRKVFGVDSKMDYFTLVSVLFYIGRDAKYVEVRREVEKIIDLYIKTDIDTVLRAHDIHLMLDLCACPYVSFKARVAALNKIRTDHSLPALSERDGAAVVKEMEGMPWFVQWGEVNLLTLIEKSLYKLAIECNG